MNKETVQNLGLDEQWTVYVTLVAVRDWFNRFEKHAPIEFGGEEELMKHVDKAISLIDRTVQRNAS